MYAYELLPMLTHLTLVVPNESEYWEERICFAGTKEEWRKAREMQEEMENA